MATKMLKLSVLQRTWKLAHKGSASKARQHLIRQASRLADKPYHQAEIIDSLIRRCSPLIREHGFEGLVQALRQD